MLLAIALVSQIAPAAAPVAAPAAAPAAILAPAPAPAHTAAAVGANVHDPRPFIPVPLAACGKANPECRLTGEAY